MRQNILIRHLRQHERFYLAMLLGVCVYLLLPLLWKEIQTIRLIVAGDAFFAAYLTGTLLMIAGLTSPHINRRDVKKQDESALFIFIVTMIAATIGLAAIFVLLHQQKFPLPFRIAMGILTVILAWLAMHVAAAFHYNYLFYSKIPATLPDQPHAKQGLLFPGTETPLPGDFLYFSFVIGMTAQVSDVQVTNTLMRRFVLSHGIVSFFFNTIILALAINVAAGLSS